MIQSHQLPGPGVKARELYKIKRPRGIFQPVVNHQHQSISLLLCSRSLLASSFEHMIPSIISKNTFLRVRVIESRGLSPQRSSSTHPGRLNDSTAPPIRPIVFLCRIEEQCVFHIIHRGATVSTTRCGSNAKPVQVLTVDPVSR